MKEIKIIVRFHVKHRDKELGMNKEEFEKIHKILKDNAIKGDTYARVMNPKTAEYLRKLKQEQAKEL